MAGASTMMRAADVASRLGLRRYPRSWRGRCPCCDYGGSAFIVRGDRDGRALLHCANGCKHDELVRAVSRAIGHPEPAQAKNQSNAGARERKRDRALSLWTGSEPVVGTLADRYLTARGLPDLATSTALRFRVDTPHPEHARIPALLGLVCDLAGVPLGIHRTYLASDGSKARVEPPKASLGPTWGGAIRLDTFAPELPLVVGEGIESSASAARLLGFPGWAAISAGNLGRGLLLPPDVRRVIIAADPDDAGRAAAREAWLRWRSDGRQVQIAVPDREGSDFNDLLLARETAHA